MRGVSWFVVGSLALVTLAGCGRLWFVEREPWRREAEEQCLKSGAVREGPAVAMLKPIQGPGICGADFPLKVAALGESPLLGYADEALRPPGSIPQSIPVDAPQPGPAYPRMPVASAPLPQYSTPVYPQPIYSTPSSPQNYPAPIYPSDVSSRDTYSPAPPSIDDDPRGLPPPRIQSSRPQLSAPEPLPRMTAPAQSVPLSPARGPGPGVMTTASVTPPATLACPIVSALDRWISEAVQPASQRWFGQPVVEIRQISAYSCRGMNGQPGAHISEHAFGNALDIAAFTLADGRQVTVKDGWRGLPEEQGFLHDVQAAACEQFTTVLAPGSNAYHYDHMHVDLMRRASGRHICEPGAMSGDEAAARARSRYARPGGPAVTGALSPREKPLPRSASGYAEDEYEEEAD